MTDLLTFRCVEIKLIEAFVEELVGANDCLLKLSEAFRKFELLDVGEGTGGCGGGTDQGR